jgi:hypothetical protein
VLSINDDGENMTTRAIGGAWRVAVLLFLAALCASGEVVAQEPGNRSFGGLQGYSHDRFEPDFASSQYHFDGRSRLDEAPRNGYAIDHDLTHYWYDQDHWYRRDDLGWIMVDAPVGAFVSVLPPYYTTVWSGGVSYYYANDAYYRWNGAQRAYEVVATPLAIDSAGTTQASGSGAIFAYARNGQSPQQQARDRDECHRLAVDAAGGDVPPELAASRQDNYVRAEAACLDARGYSVQ